MFNEILTQLAIVFQCLLISENAVKDWFCFEIVLNSY